MLKTFPDIILDFVAGGWPWGETNDGILFGGSGNDTVIVNNGDGSDFRMRGERFLDGGAGIDS